MTRSEESQGGERQMDDVKQMDVVQEEQRHNAPLEDEGLERDMRAVLGLDDPQDEAQDEPENEEQETTDAKDGETPKDEGSEDPLIEIGGEKFRLSEVQEWRKGYLRQSDYTRKTQRLAERERELQQAFQQVQPMLQLQQLLQSNPAVFRAFQTAYQQALAQAGGAARSGAPAAPYGPQTPFGAQAPGMAQPLPPEIEQLRQVAVDYQLDRQLNELRRMIDEDRQQFGLDRLTDEDWERAQEQVMREAVEARIPDLRIAYRTSSLRDQLMQEALRRYQQQQETQKRQETGRQAGAVMRGRGAPASGVKSGSAPKTLAEATRRAFAELQASGGLLAQD